MPAAFAPMPDRIRVTQGDITRADADAIVNAANESLLGGGGVDGAIHRAAGPELLLACRAIGGCPTGQARITPGFRLTARWVIHTVGPVWAGGGRGEPDLLASCYRASLALAAGRGAARVAFPAISCGVYGYPITAATDIAVRETLAFLAADDRIAEIAFVAFSDAVFAAYTEAIARRSD
jgi:O-acetyl-ADP-ribose deacetylase (regulator of RNase III)